MGSRSQQTAELQALAVYVGGLWRDEQKRLNPLFHSLSPEQQHEHRQYVADHIRALKDAVRARDFLRVCDGLGAFGHLHFSMLERAFPLMSPDERAGWLRYVWCRAKMFCPASRALRLFQAATPHRIFAVPSYGPDIIILYRGASSWTWRGALRRIRGCLSCVASAISVWNFQCPSHDGTTRTRTRRAGRSARRSAMRQGAPERDPLCDACRHVCWENCPCSCHQGRW